MTRWKLIIEYDGTDFCGWQKQTNAVSVQQTLEEAIEKFSGDKAETHVAGRTDTGVHAVAQVAHIDLAKSTNGDVIRDAVNFYLRPHKISLLHAEQVDESFHARFSALKRSYRYYILNRRPPLTLRSAYAWHIIKPLNLPAMQMAASKLIGTYDFSTFRAQNCQANSPIRTLDGLKLTQNGDEILIETEARSFLYHQVRNMVGTLTMVGSGAWSMSDFEAAFAACDRTKGGPTAPAHGLYFWTVDYPEK